MLGRKRRDVRGNGSLTETYIGQGTRIEGTVSVNGAIRVDGEIVGDIEADGDVLIAETGDVRADVSARNLVVGGRLTGTATIQERLELLATGTVVGDATMQTLIVEQGGLLEGNCQMRSDGEIAAKPKGLDPDPVG